MFVGMNQPSSSCTDGLDTRVDLYGTFIRTWLMDKEGGATCFDDGLCKQGCAPADTPTTSPKQNGRRKRDTSNEVRMGEFLMSFDKDFAQT